VKKTGFYQSQKKDSIVQKRVKEMQLSKNYRGLKVIEIENLVLEQQQQMASEFPTHTDVEPKNNI
jgi:hypothetical protein